jgi:aldehyde dehydrogenase (NAD+)
MLRFADLVEKNMDELAHLESVAMGKPISVLLGFDLPHMIGAYRRELGPPCTHCLHKQQT